MSELDKATEEEWDSAFNSDDKLVRGEDFSADRMVSLGAAMGVSETLQRFNESRVLDCPAHTEALSARSILEQGVSEMGDRARTYDKEDGERSMGKTVDMFNALTGQDLTEEQGWKFMCCLKLVRSEQGAFRADSYIDGAAYFALAGETAAANQGGES